MNLKVLLCTWEKDHNPDFYNEETEDFEAKPMTTGQTCSGIGVWNPGFLTADLELCYPHLPLQADLKHSKTLVMFHGPSHL